MMLELMGRKMTDQEWAASEFFKQTEPWGNPLMMARELIAALNDFRKYLGKPIVIHCGTQGAHIQDSYHYRGEAVDLHVVGMNVVDQFLAASRFSAFTGIGIYPHWNNPGLHLDIRHLAYNQPRARWARNAAGVYTDITAITLGQALS